MTEKQRRFVEAYMGKAAGNATEAAALAGYRGNRRTLEAVGRENLGKPRVAEAIAARVAADPLVADREARQRWWSNVMVGNVNGANGEAATLAEQLRASELLGRSQGDFLDRHEVTTVNLDAARASLRAKLADMQQRLRPPPDDAA